MRAALYALTLAAVATAVPAYATPTADETARAQALEYVNRGGDEYDAHHPEAALGWFEKAYRLVQTPKIRLNIALSELDLKRYADAARHFREDLSDSKSDEKVLSACKKGLSKAEKFVGRVELSAPTAVAIYLDDSETPLDSVVPVYVMPGTHVFRAHGYNNVTLTVGANELAKAVFTPLPAQVSEKHETVAPPPAEPSPTPKVATNTTSHRSEPSQNNASADSTKWWVAGGLAVVGVGLAVGAGVTYSEAVSDNSTIKALRGTASDCPNGASCSAFASAIRTYNGHLYLTDGLAIGAAALIGGGVLTAVLWSPHGESSSHAVVPWISPTLIGGAYEVRF